MLSTLLNYCMRCKVHCIIEKLCSTWFFYFIQKKQSYLNQKLFLKFKKAMHKILSLEPGVGFLEMLDQLFVSDLRTETVGSSI